MTGAETSKVAGAAHYRSNRSLFDSSSSLTEVKTKVSKTKVSVENKGVRNRFWVKTKVSGENKGVRNRFCVFCVRVKTKVSGCVFWAIHGVGECFPGQDGVKTKVSGTVFVFLCLPWGSENTLQAKTGDNIR